MGCVAVNGVEKVSEPIYAAEAARVFAQRFIRDVRPDTFGAR